MKINSAIFSLLGPVLFLFGMCASFSVAAETKAPQSIKKKPLLSDKNGFFPFDGSLYPSFGAETCIPELVKKAKELGRYTRVTTENVGPQESSLISRESYYEWNLQSFDMKELCEPSQELFLFTSGADKPRPIRPSNLRYSFEMKDDCGYSLPHTEIKLDPPISDRGFTLSKDFYMAGNELNVAQRKKLTQLILGLEPEYTTLANPVFFKNKKFPKSVFVVVTDGDSADDKYILFEVVKDKANKLGEVSIEPCGS